MLTAMCMEAANRIIEKTNEHNENQDFLNRIFMTCKRLQKLLYFSDVEYMKRQSGKSMFRDEFQAWESGPVIPSIYHQFMHFQAGEMEPMRKGKHEELTKDMEDVIDYVLTRTYDMDTSELIKLSHDEDGPWAKVYNKHVSEHTEIISKQEMYDFYRSRDIFA